jgi:hypothetical protein
MYILSSPEIIMHYRAQTQSSEIGISILFFLRKVPPHILIRPQFCNAQLWGCKMRKCYLHVCVRTRKSLSIIKKKRSGCQINILCERISVNPPKTTENIVTIFCLCVCMCSKNVEKIVPEWIR